jgi:hypothetical protein
VRKTEPGDTIHQNASHIGVSDGSVSGLVVREYRVLKDLDSQLSHLGKFYGTALPSSLQANFQ